MEHDVPTASDELRIADNSMAMPDAKDCSTSLLADSNAGKAGNGNKTLAPCQDAKFQLSATDASGTPARELPAIWLNTKAVNDFVLQPNDNSILKPYPEVAQKYATTGEVAPKFATTAPGLRLDLNNPVPSITSRSTDYYDSIARRENEIGRTIEPYSSPTNDTVGSLLGIAKKFGIMPPPPTPTFGSDLGGSKRQPGDGMPLERFPMKRGFTVGGSTNLITNNDYSFDVGASASMRIVPDELKSIYGSKAIEGRIELKFKF